MKFSKLVQERARVAALIAGSICFALFAVMFVGSKILRENPTSRWLGPIGVLLVAVAADGIINSELHSKRSKKWSSKQRIHVEHSPDFYVVLGIGALIVAAAFVVAGIASFSQPWFN